MGALSRPALRPALVLAALVAVLAVGLPALAAPPGTSLGLEVLSSRAEYVSGGDARVAVTFPRTVPPQQVRLFADGQELDADLTLTEAGRLEGVVVGLPLGTSTLEARPNGRGRGRPAPARVEVTNHPISGPMFSGPHQTPFYCQTEQAGLGPALDDDCSAATRVQFKYRTTTGSFVDLPAGPRPADMATTTSTTGVTVDYVVRLETGVINRAVYQTAVLYDPAVEDTDAPEATPAWNGRIVYSYGGGCNAAYAQGAGNGGVLTDLHLSRGYATASSSLNVLNNECNDVVSAETTSMVKERLIETYGADVHTIGWGGSGGAISQYTIAHNYPGLLDGLVPTLMYPDSSSISPGIGDCRLLFRWSQGDGAGVLDAAALGAVSGFFAWNNCLAWEFSFANRFDATTGCNPIVPAATWYDPVTNPDGVRCSVADNAVNVLGIDPDTGFAPGLTATEGVQYGLRALEAGELTVEQFLAVNEGVGGFDGDGLVVPERTGPSSVLDRYYATGRVVTGAGLATVPIINLRPYLDQSADIHTRYYTFNIRERLLRDNGTAANQVVQVVGPTTPAAVQAAATAGALADMDAWLTAIDAEVEDRTPAQVVAARPDTARDGCWLPDGTRVVEAPTMDDGTTCNTAYPVFGDPRYQAGGPASGDVLACQLVAPDREAYGVAFTDEQWDRLLAAFPDGVCDWDAPGVDQVAWDGPWQTHGS